MEPNVQKRNLLFDGRLSLVPVVEKQMALALYMVVVQRLVEEGMDDSNVVAHARALAGTQIGGGLVAHLGTYC